MAGVLRGYAPRDNPQIAVAAIAEHSCHGTAAAPIVRDVIDTYFVKQAAQALAEGKSLESVGVKDLNAPPVKEPVAKDDDE